VVLEVEKERKERLVSEDNLNHAVQDHLKVWLGVRGGGGGTTA
jgi:hypothetical protein